MQGRQYLSLSSTNPFISTEPRKMRAGRFSVDDARHFFPFLPVAFALGIATYFVWPSESGLHYLAALPVLLAVGRAPSLSAPAGVYELYVKSAMIFCMCLICGAGQLAETGDRLFRVGASPVYVPPAFMIGLIWLCLVGGRALVRPCGDDVCSLVARPPARAGCSHSGRGVSTRVAYPVGRYGRNA